MSLRKSPDSAVRVTVRLPASLWKSIKRRALDLDVSAQSIVITATSRWIGEQPTAKPK